MKYALDSNIVSYMLNGDKPLLAKLKKAEQQGNLLRVPSIVYYEVGRGLAAVKATAKQANFYKYCSRIGIAEIDRTAFDEAIRIYAELRAAGTPIEDADIMIAATCIRHGLTLITNNVKHFELVRGLSFENCI
jgi:predicted nucleic acid-binding protein